MLIQLDSGKAQQFLPDAIPVEKRDISMDITIFFKAAEMADRNGKRLEPYHLYAGTKERDDRRFSWRTHAGGGDNGLGLFLR
jgi:hypothetical protein